MSVTKRIKEERKSANSSGRRERRASRFYTWRPTPIELADLQTLVKEPQDLLDRLGEVLERGISLKISLSNQGDSYFAVLVEQGDYGSEVNGLSVWHSNPVRALYGVLYAALYAFPEFPNGQWPPTDSGGEW